MPGVLQHHPVSVTRKQLTILRCFQGNSGIMFLWPFKGTMGSLWTHDSRNSFSLSPNIGTQIHPRLFIKNDVQIVQNHFQRLLTLKTSQ
ncbi:hypothetical protein Plim_1154 [Planctopirus limnophila DSM 3776]|uniref:Uncharacterized protein n=1 Tax=Planctopirus limnophila (strain ATCC 43296 / DSM 3776 / IFAM 1008 / Mu 290) TaxID=521674 RepID=D5SU04_PLAL2|nr:hypothetical protein Plim_1154 [Planctopirus limnophila DSM 3776]